LHHNKCILMNSLKNSRSLSICSNLERTNPLKSEISPMFSVMRSKVPLSLLHSKNSLIVSPIKRQTKIVSHNTCRFSLWISFSISGAEFFFGATTILLSHAVSRSAQALKIAIAFFFLLRYNFTHIDRKVNQNDCRCSLAMGKN